MGTPQNQTQPCDPDKEILGIFASRAETSGGNPKILGLGRAARPRARSRLWDLGVITANWERLNDTKLRVRKLAGGPGFPTSPLPARPFPPSSTSWRSLRAVEFPPQKKGVSPKGRGRGHPIRVKKTPKPQKNPKTPNPKCCKALGKVIRAGGQVGLVAVAAQPQPLSVCSHPGPDFTTGITIYRSFLGSKWMEIRQKGVAKFNWRQEMCQVRGDLGGKGEPGLPTILPSPAWECAPGVGTLTCHTREDNCRGGQFLRHEAPLDESPGGSGMFWR